MDPEIVLGDIHHLQYTFEKTDDQKFLTKAKDLCTRLFNHPDADDYTRFRALLERADIHTLLGDPTWAAADFSAGESFLNQVCAREGPSNYLSDRLDFYYHQGIFLNQAGFYKEAIIA